MNGYDFILSGAQLTALGSGALWWRDNDVLIVSDLHLGKSERLARRGGPVLPPYETRDALSRLADDMAQCHARTVICLGDSFDDLAAGKALSKEDRQCITRLQTGIQWVWIEGNHDPGSLDIGGCHLAELSLFPLIFRHISQAGATGEVSGHYHPKNTICVRGRNISRPAFLVDKDRVIMPAYGTYTGGLRSDAAILTDLMRTEALAIMTGPVPLAVPMHRTRK